MKQAQLGQYLQMLANDIDQIKHIVRGIQWRQDALCKHFNIAIQPDVLEAIVNPSQAFLNQIVQETRAQFVGKDKSLSRRKSRRRKK